MQRYGKLNNRPVERTETISTTNQTS